MNLCPLYHIKSASHLQTLTDITSRTVKKSFFFPLMQTNHIFALTNYLFRSVLFLFVSLFSPILTIGLLQSYEQLVHDEHNILIFYFANAIFIQQRYKRQNQ